MADITQFVPPSWLEDQDAETIHARMMQSLPEDIDDTEGGFPWDFTKPAALEKAELLEFNLMETAKIMHYMFSYGIYLDYHAAGYGMERKGASYASGTVTVTGSPNTVIPAGFLFAVPASGDNAAITFSTLEEATISTDGTVDIPVQATEAGTGGNVAADTIVIMASPTIIGINRITNSNAITGGAAEEEDDALRQRIKERLESADASFVGCDADYKRWAKEVEGITTGLTLDLNPQGHTNNDTDRASFGYTDGNGTNHPLTFSDNFDWENGGFKTDEQGGTYLCIKCGTSVTFDRSVFADDAMRNGKEIKLIFKATNCRNYDAEIGSCLADGIGIKLQAQKATVSSEQTTMDAQYCEDSRIEMDINIESDSADRIMMLWLEGIPSRVAIYEANDNFTQDTPAKLKFGSNDCDVWLYRVKAYSNSLRSHSSQYGIFSTSRRTAQSGGRTWSTVNLHSSGALRNGRRKQSQ